ncbi:MAG: ROK family protein [Nanoarchaeota archaeon]|nr:ROK family protein [Nanoarchaeota archaeon]
MILIKAVVDIGGTKTEIGIERKGEIIRSFKYHTPKTKKEFLTKLVQNVKLVIGKNKVKGLGVSVASAVHNGTVLNPPNLPLRNFDLEDYLCKQLKIKVKVENDANCFALAELHYGHGKDYNNFVLVALGTGIGGGIIINKKLYNAKGSAGEIGHIPLSDSKQKCGLGHKGCFEAMASGKALVKLSKKIMGKEYKAFELVNMSKKGNKKAGKVLSEISGYLGIGFSSIVNILNPDAIIISGGLRDSAPYMLKEAKKVIKEKSMAKVDIKVSKVQREALLGAATLI